jgi:predicted ester cyclase
VIKTDPSDIYRRYTVFLNKQNWPKLEQFVHDQVYYKRPTSHDTKYREILEREFYEVSDLYFNIQLLISEPPYIASRLLFDRTPKRKFLGLHINGKRVTFTENVFYEFRREKVAQTWSVIDKAAIEAPLWHNPFRYPFGCAGQVRSGSHPLRCRASQRVVGGALHIAALSIRKAAQSTHRTRRSAGVDGGQREGQDNGRSHNYRCCDHNPIRSAFRYPRHS